MYSFDYRKAASLEDAVTLMTEAEDGVFVAGGMTLIPTMKQRLANPSDLIDLGAIAEMRGIEAARHAVTIGALATHAEVETSAEVRRLIPALADLAGRIGDPLVRNRGTLGGSIANNDPAADYPAGLVGLGATVRTNAREIAADDFFVDLFETALEECEIVTHVTFHVPRKAAYMKFPQPASRFALVGVFVAETSDGVRVAVTGAGPCVFRVPAMETALAANFAPEAVAEITVPSDGLNSDIHGSAEYRAHLVTVMAKRAVAKANAGGA